MRIISTDWIPRMADAGYDALIEGLAPEGLEVGEFLNRLNAVGSQSPFNERMLVEYISDRQAAGFLQSVEVQDFGLLPEATSRYAAPTGLGTDGTGLWFGEPALGTEYVRWYVNGALALREQRDLSSNRYVALTAVGAEAGDVVQVCIEAGGVVGWWGRVTV